MKKIGFIGLGNMGKGMAINISKQDIPIMGFDINKDVFKTLDRFNIDQAKNLSELVNYSDIIITMLPDGKAVKKVWDQIIKFPKNKITVIDCSTIDVETSIRTQKKANIVNILTLDAPVSGGVMGADKGTLTFMVGGKKETFNDVKYLFEIMGKNVILCGDSGAGQSAKICNNLLLATTMIAVGESFKLGKSLNLNLNNLFKVLSTSSGSCWAINNYCPIAKVGPKTPADNKYEGGFSTDLMLKDLSLALNAANSKNLQLSYGRQTKKKYKNLVDNNQGHLDFSNIINLIN